MTVKEIGAALGYVDPGYFNRFSPAMSDYRPPAGI